jgi:hypothetical protein
MYTNKQHAKETSDNYHSASTNIDDKTLMNGEQEDQQLFKHTLFCCLSAELPADQFILRYARIQSAISIFGLLATFVTVFPFTFFVLVNSSNADGEAMLGLLVSGPLIAGTWICNWVKHCKIKEYMRKGQFSIKFLKDYFDSSSIANVVIGCFFAVGVLAGALYVVSYSDELDTLALILCSFVWIYIFLLTVVLFGQSCHKQRFYKAAVCLEKMDFIRVYIEKEDVNLLRQYKNKY